MDRRSFLLASLLPVVAAKRGLLGLPHPPLFVPWWADRKFRILTLKARSLGMSRLVAMQWNAMEMARMSGVSIWNKGFKRDDVADRLLLMKSNGY